MKRIFPTFCALALGLQACAGIKLGSPNSPASRSTSSQEKAEEAALQSVLQNLQTKKSDYKLGGADLIEITVFQQPEMSRSLRVSQNGTITFPLIGTVKVGGLSVAEAEEALSTKLKDYVISPQITIFIKEYGNKKVFVLGEVTKPGSFELPTEAKLTVLEAISLAGGFTGIAAPDRTKVIRNIDGKSQSFKIVVSDITSRGEKHKDIPLEPNDVVWVPQSFF
ncbi:MAG TPA: polysaccharide biosynthesis protein [Elusimicrobia bacterium]|nr:polysaccharide biosynthesis protein [Elusimicrobiota bacterium]HBT62219.1 polysaccharide biosynthesis protein [Elusimicrobiota bacterium]